MVMFLYPKQAKLQIRCTLFEPKINVIFQNDQNKVHHKLNSVQGMPKGFINQIEEIHPKIGYEFAKRNVVTKKKKGKKKIN